MNKYGKILILYLFCTIQIISSSLPEERCKDKEGLIKKLSLFDLSKIPCMYSSTTSIDIDGIEKESFFSILVQSKNTESDPLLIWLNGEFSSMLGLFSEIGPLRLLYKNHNDVIGKVEKGFNDFANLLFIDFPLGTGYSLVNRTHIIPKTQGDISKHFYLFLEAFIDKNPEFENSDIIIAGENFCGKFIPHIAKHILSENDKIVRKRKLGKIFNLKKIFIGNGIFDMKYHVNSRKSLLRGLSLINNDDEIQYEFLTKNCIFDLVNNRTSSIKSCNNQMKFIEEISGYINKFEISRNEEFFEKEENLINEYLNKKIIIKELGLFNFKPKTYNLKNNSILAILGESLMLHSSKKSLQKIIDFNKTEVIIYSGMLDLVNGPSGTEKFLSELKFEEKVTPNREVWSIKLNDNNLEKVGFLKRFSNKFLYLNTKKGGYFLTRTQRPLMYYTFENLIKGQVNEFNNCHKSECDVIQLKCKTLSNCSGNGICNKSTNGVCKCNDHFYGPDCSYEIQHIISQKLLFKPKELKIFTFYSNYDYYLELKNTDKFIFSLADNPNEIHIQNKHQFILKNQKSVSYLYLYKDFINDKILVIKNNDNNNSTLNIKSFTTNFKINFWGPGSSIFLISMISLAIGVSIFHYIYSLYQRSEEFKNNSYSITSMHGNSFSAEKKNNNEDSELIMYKEFKILPR